MPNIRRGREKPFASRQCGRCPIALSRACVLRRRSHGGIDDACCGPAVSRLTWSHPGMAGSPPDGSPSKRCATLVWEIAHGWRTGFPCFGSQPAKYPSALRCAGGARIRRRLRGHHPARVPCRDRLRCAADRHRGDGGAAWHGGGDAADRASRRPPRYSQSAVARRRFHGGERHACFRTRSTSCWSR